MRGKPLIWMLFLPVIRITPADAGKTHQPVNPVLNVEDHPRGCGENMFSGNVCPVPIGSPPQVRGKLNCPAGKTNTGGITPAGAGKTTVEV